MSIQKSKYIEGIKACEKNAFELMDLAGILFDKGMFKLAYLCAFISIEECGKAGFIIEKLRSNHITEKEWMYKKTFRGHIPKINKARELIVEAVTGMIPLLSKVNAKIGILGLSPADIEDYWSLRNNVIFVDYDFKNNVWTKPQNINNIKELAFNMIDNARTAFMSFEEILTRHRIDTLLKKR